MQATISKEALHFLEHETQFHLGMMPTEQSHPLTENLSETTRADTAKGIVMLYEVDHTLSAVIEKVVKSEPFAKLVSSLSRALGSGHNILFSGCGATGRLSLILEAAWREFWNTRPAAEQELYLDRILGMITGGDRALVRSVEGFEDFQTFGRRQLRDYGIGKGDVVVAVSEGGETSSVIGSALQALESGAEVFFAFNNPAELLCKYIERSRSLIEATGVTVLDLTSGPMALAGSTRMQAVTMELVVLGNALESAIEKIVAPEAEPDSAGPAERFENLVTALMAPANVAALAALVEREEQCYRQHGRVTYVTDHFTLDLMQDTTERAPTFSLPPFRRRDDRTSMPSWAFIKHPTLKTGDAWLAALGHEPRGLEWTPEDYQALGAPESIWRNPPPLSGDSLYEFGIGCEHDLSRIAETDSLAVVINVAGRADPVPEAFQQYLSLFHARHSLVIQTAEASARSAEATVISCPMPASPLRLWERLALKLVFNTLSTATMVRMDYVAGNWMSRAEASNKKLIDRGIRLVAQLGGLSYRDACIEFHQTLAILQAAPKELRSTTAPAVATLERLGITT